MEEKDKKELQDTLDKLKAALEESLTKKVKEDYEKQIKAVSDKLAELEKKEPEVKSESFKALETLLKEVKEAADKNQPVIDAFVANGQKNNNNAQPKTFNENLAAAILEKTDEIEKFIRKDVKNVVIDLKVVGDVTIGNVTGSARYGAQFGPGIHEAPKRRVHIRQLLPVSSAGPGNTFTFMKEDGAGEGAIAPTAETATKPPYQ